MNHNLRLPKPAEVADIKLADVIFEKKISELVAAHGKVSEFYKVNCLRRGIAFMNRCGPGTRHKTVLRGQKLIFMKHEDQDSLAASAATATLARLAGSDEIANTTSCGVIRKFWAEGSCDKLPEPMKPYYRAITGDDMIITGWRLLKSIQRKMPKGVELKHDDNALWLGTDNTTAKEYVKHQLLKMGFTDIQRGPSGSANINTLYRINGEDVDLRISTPLARVYHNGSLLARDRYNEVTCLDCCLESLAASFLGKITALSAKHTDDVTRLQLGKIIKACIEDSAVDDNDINTISISSPKTVGDCKGNVRPHYANRADSGYSYSTNAWNNKELGRYRCRFEKALKHNTISVSFRIPAGNAGTVKFTISKLQRLINNLRILHPEIRPGEDYDEPKLTELISGTVSSQQEE